MRKIRILIIIVLVVIVSQWVMIKLAYAEKLSPATNQFISRIYNLKAGSITDGEKSYNIYLSDYLAHKDFFDKSLVKGAILDDLDENTNTKEIAWQRAVKDQWLRNFAREYGLDDINEEEINESMTTLTGTDEFEEFTESNYQLSWPKFKTMLIEPYILEGKVYYYLLNNYNDIAGVKKAQDAYDALESGQDFIQVSQDFSTDQTYAENSIWLTEEDLVNFYEPIAKLETGQHSKIVTVVGGYLIWYVENKIEEDGKTVWEVKSIFINAKSLEDFFQDYLKKVSINKKI